MRTVLATAFIALLGVASCSAQKSERCARICEREAECAEEAEFEAAGFKFDKGECQASCTALERDTEGAEIVAGHDDCVKRASDCRAVFACK